jgi:plastocyanin
VTRIKTLMLPGTVVLLAAALSACGGSGGGSEQAASAPAAATATATATPAAKSSDWPDGGTPKKSSAKKDTSASAPAASGAKAVQIKGFAFGPSNVTVKVGQKVTWTNQDDAPHTVTGGELDSGTLAKGASFSFTPTKAGAIAYICAIHPSMKGTLTVQ